MIKTFGHESEGNKEDVIRISGAGRMVVCSTKQIQEVQRSRGGNLHDGPRHSKKTNA